MRRTMTTVPSAMGRLLLQHHTIGKRMPLPPRKSLGYEAPRYNSCFHFLSAQTATGEDVRLFHWNSLQSSDRKAVWLKCHSVAENQ
ncbi:hypothetical protein IF2G_03709 [Cordyceps javanica]|nr:hypothetical protein IF2G_03709 [Cordyceps javanica]